MSVRVRMSEPKYNSRFFLLFYSFIFAQHEIHRHVRRINYEKRLACQDNISHALDRYLIKIQSSRLRYEDMRKPREPKSFFFLSRPSPSLRIHDRFVVIIFHNTSFSLLVFAIHSLRTFRNSPRNIDKSIFCRPSRADRINHRLPRRRSKSSETRIENTLPHYSQNNK